MLVGRAPERRVVEALVAGARLGRSGVLVVTGDAGIGKTELLRYAESVATDVRILRATGVESEREVPFGGLAQLLRPLVDRLERIPPPQAQALGTALALREGPAVDRFAVGAATLSLLTLASEEQPLGLLVDDAHLLDEPSVQAVAFAARRLLADRVFLLAAVRTNEPAPLLLGLSELHLEGLDEQATRELIDLTRAEVGPTDLPVRLHHLTAGNPLAILALANEPEHLEGGRGGIPVPVPEALARAFVRDADALDGDARAALLVAAASGGDLASVARACTSLGVPIAALTSAEDAGLVSLTDERVEFRHPLVRSSLYGTATAAQRRRIHATLANAVPDHDLDRRAWHRSLAAIGPDENAAVAMDATGARAVARGAHSVAASAYARAASLTPDDATRGRRLLRAAQAAWDAGEASRAGTLLDDALALDKTPGFVSGCLGLRGMVAARTGSLVEARHTLVEAAALVRGDEPALALRQLADAVEVCFYLGDSSAAVSLAASLEALVDAAVGETGRALGRMAIGVARVLAGESGADDLRAAVSSTTVREGSADATPPTLPSGWLMIGPLFLRDSSTGRELVQQALSAQREQAAVGSLPHLLFHIARDSAASDHWTAAAADYTEAIELARELGQTTELATSLAGLAWLSARIGDEEGARSQATEALDLCAIQGNNLGTAWTTYALGDLALGLGDPETAVSRYDELMTLLDAIGLLDVDVAPGPELVEALLRTGQAERAEDVGTAYWSRASAKGQPWALARANRIRGLLADPADIDEPFGQAISLHARTLDVYELARTRLAYGARLRRARRRVDARAELRAALQAFDRLGARPWADAAATELEASGETAQRGGVEGLDRLTPRELQISRLLAEGHTTREAAAALFMSPKTVEYHLRNVYMKFGINTRAQLAERLSRLAM